MSFEPGTLFAGDYRVVKPLNKGGMGAVYVVQQLSTGKHRALKLMHSSLVYDPASRAKFEQEARIGARIASEHVVEVVAAGVDAQTQIPYLVMELLDGEDMSARLKRGPFHPGEAALVLEQIAHALGAAHDAGVVHRDLKPENVFLGISKRSTAGLVVKVLDFGIAKVTEENQKNTTGAYGTPMWLAPEQTRRGEITPAADVWAFGLVAFTMLTGHPFWRHAEGPQASLPSLIQDITVDPIPHASERAIEFAMRLPPGFDTWLQTALQRDPRMRFPNVRFAWTALAPVLTGPTPTSTAVDVAAKKPNGVLVAFVAVLALVVVGMLAAGAVFFMMHDKAAPPPVAATTTASVEASAVTTTTAAPLESTPIVATPPPVEDQPHVGGMVIAGSKKSESLYDDAVRKFNGDLAVDLDKCLATLKHGKNSAHSMIMVTVAPDGSVTSSHPMVESRAGPVAQCLADAISHTRFAPTKTGGDLVFQLLWTHA